MLHAWGASTFPLHARVDDGRVSFMDDYAQLGVESDPRRSDCCRSQVQHLLFRSGLGSHPEASDCAALCRRVRGCGIFLHSRSYQRCLLCSGCDVRVGPQPHAHRYSVWRSVAPPESADPLRHARSFGVFPSATDVHAQLEVLARLAGRVAGAILFIGDSQLRNQFLALTRLMLGVPRDMPLAQALYASNASDSLAGGVFEPASTRRSSDAMYADTNAYFWHTHPFMLAQKTSGSKLTLAFVKLLFDCDGLPAALSLAQRRLVRRDAWPPTVVVWNFGLWYLHLSQHTPKGVDARVLRCSAAYDTLVERSVLTLAAAAPEALLFWRTSNAVCESLFEDRC